MSNTARICLTYRLAAIIFLAVFLGSISGGTAFAMRGPSGAPTREVGNCSDLALLHMPNTVIGSATSAQDGKLHFCRVVGVVKPTSDSNINFELWLPPPNKWNGKFYSNSGAGSLGAILLAPLRSGTERGYAAMSQDRGHASRDDKGSAFGSDGSWALGHPHKITDWSYRGQHLSTIAAKAIVAAYYGHAAQHSYFEGCSAGGHQAVIEAERFPEDFDGIIAGAPGWEWTHAVVTRLWAGTPARLSSQNLISVDKLKLLHKSALDACDRLDGLADGLIGRPFACNFDPGVLQCKSGDAPDCLTAEQVETARKIYQGPVRPNGEPLGTGYAPGSELGWAQYMSDTVPGSAADFFRYWAFGNKDYDSRRFDFDRDWDRARESRVDGKPMFEVTDSVGNLEGYRKLGGKLIWWNGLADPDVSPAASLRYYQAVASHSPLDAVDSVLRLFFAPGVAHCGGGDGPNSVDFLAALESWVENGIQPERIIASNVAPDASVTRTRPLCAYPKIAQYTGAGSVNEAQNFTCAIPN